MLEYFTYNPSFKHLFIFDVNISNRILQVNIQQYIYTSVYVLK